ncbi:phosphotriesterase [Streptomyces sp. LX-29]|uniref:phosphotriesterase family protein n=1 Tax=Streptomyces sp. LX-29 TaxID=2900152 RepID=UPI00240D079E|nr:phosphotriesterase [Streptomyces sp. LX-29]WFB06402.1 phosphotriesterase [Streptomyces sp. LX-29]
MRTVLGDVPAAELGVCDAHDHLFLRSPLLPGQELDDPAAAADELRAFAAAGGRAVVQWTPYGMGRGAGHLAELSRATGVRIVAATGLHQARHYAPALLDRVRDRLAELFLAELTLGIGRVEGIEGFEPSTDLEVPGSGGGAARRATHAGHDAETPPRVERDRVTAPRAERDTETPPRAERVSETSPRAGLIKVAGGFHGLDAHARATMAAAAVAHHRTGAPIGVHLELGTGALDVLDLLCGELGVAPDRVILGHLNRSPDLPVHRKAAELGAYLAFDGPSHAHHATDWRLSDALSALADAGHADRLLLGGDTTTAAARFVNGGPGLPHLLRGLRARLELSLPAELVTRVFTANPARAFAVDWPAPAG